MSTALRRGSLCELKPGSEDESFLVLDPKRKGAPAQQQPKGRAPFREVVVFMIGGGSYAEYQNVQEYAKRHPDRLITYGCTELANGEMFLNQLGSL